LFSWLYLLVVLSTWPLIKPPPKSLTTSNNNMRRAITTIKRTNLRGEKPNPESLKTTPFLLDIHWVRQSCLMFCKEYKSYWLCNKEDKDIFFSKDETN